MTRTFAPRPWMVALVAGGALAAGAFAARTPMPGRFLFLVIVVAAGGEALRMLLVRPFLRADEHGIEVVTGLRRERFPWAEVGDMTTLRPPGAHGPRRSANALDIDLGDRVIVVPAYRLGTSGEEAADSLEALRASISSSTDASPRPW